MKPNRFTGPLMALALMCAPAIPALARPVSTHTVDMDWSTSQSGVFTNGNVTVTHDELGQTNVDLLVLQSSLIECDGGLLGVLDRSVSHSGPADVSIAIDRHMDEIALNGQIDVTESTTVSCPGAATVNTVQASTTDVDLLAVAADRPVRSRDQQTGTRSIVRAADVTVSLDLATYADSGLVTEEISR